MKKIISVGLKIPGNEDLCIDYVSDRTILGADIILFEPDILSGYSINQLHNGKPLVAPGTADKILEATEHWKREIETALGLEKIVIVFLKGHQDFVLNTAKKTPNEMRNGVAFKELNNYSFVPKTFPRAESRVGNDIKYLNVKGFELYWKELQEIMEYEMYFLDDNKDSIFLTRGANKPVGLKFKGEKGFLYFLPTLKFRKYKIINPLKHTEEWNRLGTRFIQTLISIYESSFSSKEKTPPPNWVDFKIYTLSTEEIIKKKIGEDQKKAAELQLEIESNNQKLENEIILKDLLFEKGVALELAISSGLRILGYKVENYRDGDFEIDHMITSPEGQRYIGESEGKDNDAINIDKFRQLESNIHEDLARGSSEPARGVLFGNGYRMTEPSKRQNQFTETCIKNAKRTTTVLINTCDLFSVAKYLKDSNDNGYAEACRKAIFSCPGGVLTFPAVK